jgi:hypothetical protein
VGYRDLHQMREGGCTYHERLAPVCVRNVAWYSICVYRMLGYPMPRSLPDDNRLLTLTRSSAGPDFGDDCLVYGHSSGSRLNMQAIHLIQGTTANLAAQLASDSNGRKLIFTASDGGIRPSEQKKVRGARILEYRKCIWVLLDPFLDYCPTYFTHYTRQGRVFRCIYGKAHYCF